MSDPATPLQRWAESTTLPDGPALVILEDVTGAGKTEAAQMLVHRFMAAGRATGAYWAMPTQATANAMYARQAKAFDALYEKSERRPSLVLSHGQQRLHEGFRSTVLDGAADHPESWQGHDIDDLPGSVACAGWLADDRRAAMLADVGAGTIDQALLSVLPSRFNTIRLFGLVDKVLVVDEAHAYDKYMGVELDELLRFQASLGGNGVVLSATLPRGRREELATAWTDGVLGGQRRFGQRVDASSMAYPLATVVSRDALREEARDPASWSTQSVPVRLVLDFEDAALRVARAAEMGAAVAWVRNTVDDCLRAAEFLRVRHGIEALVFHARFAQCDRQARERDVLGLFGKGSSEPTRRGRVLIATQVIEQSLDLDFDVMMSDIAPIDLLVQRSGRLWRHPQRARPQGIERELLVLSPPPDDDPPSGWLSGVFAGTARVYENAGILWRTVRILSRVGSINTPAGLRDLIESVYGSDEIPDSLLNVTNRAMGKESGNAATATYGTLKVTDGYDGSQHHWTSDLRVPTRLTDPQTVVRLARVRDDGSLAPWASDAEPSWKAWALSEIRLSGRRVPHDALPDARWADAASATRASWSRFDQTIPLLIVQRSGSGSWFGHLSRPDSTVIPITYTEAGGLAYAATTGQ